MESELHICRICKSSNLNEVVNLGKQIITSRFPNFGDFSTPSTSIRLVMCAVCNLVQLKDTTASCELYEHMYGYRSGVNATMRNHLQQYNEQLQELAELHDGDYVLDIGSNDATFLHNYRSGLNRVGCDPTGKQFIEYYNDLTLIPNYFTKQNIHDIISPTIKFKAISSISMFYDLPDPVQFAKDIHSVLDNDGVWTLEQSYVGIMLDRNSIDTICHEHLEYYGVKQIKNIMDRSGFKIINISLNDCNGGSFRIYVMKAESTRIPEATITVQQLLQNEEQLRIHTLDRYVEFNRSCKEEVSILVNFIKNIKLDKKTIYIYGASTKGNCLLQYANIDSNLVQYAVERNPLKIGKMTSTGIEIISEEVMRQNPPDYLLVLPWHFRTEMIQREAEYLTGGGQFIFPFPHFEVYSSRPKALITGIDGQIAHYVSEKYRNTHIIYGITHRLNTSDKHIHRFANSLSNINTLEPIIKIIKPQKLIHLASISNTEDSDNNPINTIQTNGIAITHLCDIIHRTHINCRIFNASSSEIYKGHITYTISEDDDLLKPESLYAIAKELSHNIVNYYRNKYNIHCSNGVLFTTESPRRKPTFLLKKISIHAAEWNTTNSVLHLGSLDSYRNINHASDIADAIYLILEQDSADNYLLCGGNHMKVEDIVIAIYALCNIHLIKHKNIYIDSKTKLPVIEVGTPLRNTITNINGNATKLKAIGWDPKFDMSAIIKDMCLL